MIHQPFTPQRKEKAKKNMSPQTPQLQGASCVTGRMIFILNFIYLVLILILGGVLHGRAHGNKANMADLIDADKNTDKSQEMWERVFLCLSNDNPATINPAEAQSTTSCLVPMTGSIKPTLEKVAAKYSPIKSTYLIFEHQF